MTVKLISIGNSKGIRLPKAFIEACNLEGEVHLQIKDKTLIIKPVAHPRKNWEQYFKAMHATGDDALLDDEIMSTSWDEENWTW